ALPHFLLPALLIPPLYPMLVLALKTFSKKVMETLWRQAADMVLLWAELYWMDNVTDHCLERGGGGGYQGLCGFDSEKEKEMGGNERVQECATAVL
ncbi:hypothetical protein KUCAC02_030162, partial [Chaenocephalus aceratus]